MTGAQEGGDLFLPQRGIGRLGGKGPRALAPGEAARAVEGGDPRLLLRLGAIRLLHSGCVQRLADAARAIAACRQRPRLGARPSLVVDEAEIVHAGHQRVDIGGRIVLPAPFAQLVREVLCKLEARGGVASDISGSPAHAAAPRPADGAACGAGPTIADCYARHLPAISEPDFELVTPA